MRTNFRLQTILSLLVVCATISLASAESKIDRRVAVTFDDLPIAGSVQKDDTTSRRMTLELLASLAGRDIPVIGFVNEIQLRSEDKVDDSKVDLLRLWLGAGFDLGNHSYSHPDLHRVSLEDFQTDVVRGEPVTRQLLDERDKSLEYFRHPYLHTGRDLDTKVGLQQFLGERGYRVAPVSIDNSEWIYARAYDLAIQAKDYSLAEQIGAEYVDYMLEVFAFYEDQSQQLFNRNISHVLLVHANELNSVWFGELADRLSMQGYEFITLDAALKDPAYRSADTYTGPAGMTWLHRWAITAKVDPSMFRGEPETPPHILELAELK